jgi:hypothetical protein
MATIDLPESNDNIPDDEMDLAESWPVFTQFPTVRATRIVRLVVPTRPSLSRWRRHSSRFSRRMKTEQP